MSLSIDFPNAQLGKKVNSMHKNLGMFKQVMGNDAHKYFIPFETSLNK